MNFCKRCGTPLPGAQRESPQAEPESASSPKPESASSPRICQRCHGALDQDAQFCKYCGLSLGRSPHPEPMPDAAGHVALERASGGAPSSQTGPLGGAASVRRDRARLVAILKDGSEGQTYPLSEEATEIGRKEGTIILPDDPYLSPRHARLTEQNGRYFLKDLASTNGIFIRIRDKSRLHHGDVLLVGQQVLRFEVLEESERGLGPASQHGTLLFGTPEGSCIARLGQMTTEGIMRDYYHLRGQEVVIGREGPDIVFPDDPFMSRKHARISYDGGSRAFVLEDLGSFNGTSLRFRGERELQSGDQFRVGNHLFLFETGGVES
jgi:pSer/pThr/pTyr-binding forkhead associated (FHA) protein